MPDTHDVPEPPKHDAAPPRPYPRPMWNAHGHERLIRDAAHEAEQASIGFTLDAPPTEPK